MRNNEVYQAQVFSVLKNKDLRSSLYEEDLLAIGVIKRTTSYTLIIRNKIYEAILRDTLYSDQNNGVVMKKYKVFIGSSSEGRKIAEAIQVNLEYAVESTIWHQGVFGLSTGTLESLVTACSKYDYAILVLTPDDLTVKRGRGAFLLKRHIVS